MTAGACHVQGCDISSTTGTGVGTEGGSVTLVDCRIHDCKRHGAAFFGSLYGEEGAIPQSPPPFCSDDCIYASMQAALGTACARRHRCGGQLQHQRQCTEWVAGHGQCKRACEGHRHHWQWRIWHQCQGRRCAAGRECAQRQSGRRILLKCQLTCNTLQKIVHTRIKSGLSVHSLFSTDMPGTGYKPQCSQCPHSQAQFGKAHTACSSSLSHGV